MASKMAELMLMSLLLLAGLFLSVKRVRRHFYAQKACRGREFKSQQRCLMFQKPSLLKACMLGSVDYLNTTSTEVPHQVKKHRTFIV